MSKKIRTQSTSSAITIAILGASYGRYELSDFGADFLRAMRGGKPLCRYRFRDRCANGAANRSMSPDRNSLCRLRALLKSGRLVAGVAVDSRVPRQWWPEEVDFGRPSRQSRLGVDRACPHLYGRCVNASSAIVFLREHSSNGVDGHAGGNARLRERPGARLFWCSGGALLGAGWLAYVHPEEQDRDRRTMEEVARLWPAL